MVLQDAIRLVMGESCLLYLSSTVLVGKIKHGPQTVFMLKDD